jgi:hypothetical protein
MAVPTKDPRDKNVGVNQYKNPYMDGSGAWPPPTINYGMQFADYGSLGLRQYGGWVREEFLPQLVGREAARVYREMLDNDSTIGSMIFSITQAMRKVEWRIEAASDNGKDVNGETAETKFLDSLMHDMSHTWEDFIAEALSMLGYGFAINELVYKRRLGSDPGPSGIPGDPELPQSKYNDGMIGWRRMPIRGQDTILKWFFDINGQVTGVTQQPWVGVLIDIPVEKFLLFRPTAHKANPEGRSVIRNCYRSYWFRKRLEELEAIMYERMSGFPVCYVPSELLEQAQTVGNASALATLNYYKSLVTNVRVNEQMGALLPSDPYRDNDGKLSNVRMFEFQLLTPQHGGRSVSANDTIARHKLDMLSTLLCDFVVLGHEVRGTNNLAVTKVDMFYGAIEGWLNTVAAVMNSYAIPRIWKINALPPDRMPQLRPDMATRLDLDSLGNFVANLAKAGMPLFPDEELQTFLRDAGGMPELTDPAATRMVLDAASAGNGKEQMDKLIKAAAAKRVIQERRSAA